MRVLHFVRKKDQLRASFVLNQIASHKSFQPFIAFRKGVVKNGADTFAEFDLENYKYLNLSEGETPLEKLLFKTAKVLSARQVKAVLDFVEENKIDICHFHYGTDCGVFFPLTGKLPVPFVVSFYGYDCSSFPSFLMGYGRHYLKKRVFQYCTKAFAMSPDMKKDLMAAGCPEKKTEVHYYGTDARKFYYERSYTQKEKVILFNLSTLVPQKGHIFLLRGIAALVEAGTRNFELRLAGSGELEEELKAFVTNNNLDEYVKFIGALKYASPQMMHEYQYADVFVHPSVIAPNGDKEGIPGTIIEAMSAGLPVVSTFHAGIPHIIESGKSGLLVEEHDVTALSSSMEKFINNSSLREELGRKGQEYALNQLDLHKNELQLEQLYRDIISDKK